MALVRPGDGVTDISGSMAGNVFARDSSGLHIRPKPRHVNSPTPAQRKQRNAFARARTYSKDNRTVSYLIYRALNNLPFLFDAFVTGDPVPDCQGKYILAGQYFEVDYYERVDSGYAIWYIEFFESFFITPGVDNPVVPLWSHWRTIQGTYDPWLGSSGHPIVRLQIQPPPPDYNPPGL